MMDVDDFDFGMPEATNTPSADAGTNGPAPDIAPAADSTPPAVDPVSAQPPAPEGQAVSPTTPAVDGTPTANPQVQTAPAAPATEPEIAEELLTELLLAGNPAPAQAPAPPPPSGAPASEADDWRPFPEQIQVPQTLVDALADPDRMGAAMSVIITQISNEAAKAAVRRVREFEIPQAQQAFSGAQQHQKEVQQFNDNFYSRYPDLNANRPLVSRAAQVIVARHLKANPNAQMTDEIASEIANASRVLKQRLGIGAAPPAPPPPPPHVQTSSRAVTSGSFDPAFDDLMQGF